MLGILPRVLALLIFIFAAFAVYLARTPAPSNEVQESLQDWSLIPSTLINVSDALFGFNHYLLVGSITIALVGATAASIPFRKPKVARHDPDSLYGKKTRFVTFGCVLLTILIFIGSPVLVPQVVGPLFIFDAFIVCLLLILAQLSYWSDKHGIPYVAILLLFAYLISGTNDNHNIFKDSGEPSKEGQNERNAFSISNLKSNSYGGGMRGPIEIGTTATSGIQFTWLCSDMK